MEAIECIKSRRSIRKFEKKEIPKEVIEKILDCARHAPSSRNSQPWEFILVRSEEKKKKLAELKGKENEEAMLTAPLLIIVCSDRRKSKARWIEDAVCAAQNILLAAHSLGLGSVYITGYSTRDPNVEVEIRKILRLPEHVIPVCIIPIGYPAEKPEPKELRELNEIVHEEEW